MDFSVSSNKKNGQLKQTKDGNIEYDLSFSKSHSSNKYRMISQHIVNNFIDLNSNNEINVYKYLNDLEI